MATATRSVRLTRPIDANGLGALVITAGKVVREYAIRLFSAYQGEGFGVELRKADGETHHVHVDEAGATSCDCRGHVRHGHCKHADVLVALLGRGLLR